MKLGFLSDIHEDIVSLKKGLELLHKVNCDRIICLGDIIGFSNPYYPFGDTKDANECINMVRKNCSVVVPGNHDLFSVGRIPDFNAGIEYPDNWFSLDIASRMDLMKERIWLYEKEIIPELTEENMHYLQSLSEYQIIETDDCKILFTHFLFPDVSGSLRKRIDDIYDYRAHFLFMRKNNCNLSFAGHMHKEGFEVINRKGYQEHRFRKKKLEKTESFIGLPSLAAGRNKNGVAVFDTESFEIQAFRIK
jgi:predicted phosphodiesterase